MPNFANMVDDKPKEVKKEIVEMEFEDQEENISKTAFEQRIIEETGIPLKEIRDMVNKKIKELKGLISPEGALFIVGKELGIDLKGKDHPYREPIEMEFELDDELSIEDNEEQEEMEFELDDEPLDIQEDAEIVSEVPKKEEKHELATVNQQLPNIQNITSLPSIQEVDAFLAMYNHVKNAIVDKSDFHTYKDGNAPRMKKSGWRKFIKPFNLSVELIREEDLGKENPRLFEFGIGPDGNPDVHAEVWVRVSVTHVVCKECGYEVQGQSIEALGYKSKSEYWSTKWKNFGSYDLHNLITTARTRGENIGISDLVGFGEVSAEEIKGATDS